MRKENQTLFLKTMGAWAGNPEFETGETMTKENLLKAKINKRKIISHIITFFELVLLLFLAVGSGGLYVRVLQVSREMQALYLVNQEGGTIMIANDGKKFISFRMRTLIEKDETPEFLQALQGIRFIPEIKGVHIDAIKCTPASLEALKDIKLEQITVRNTGITKEQAEEFMQARPEILVLYKY